MKTIKIENIDYKLNAYKDILLLHAFDISTSNVDGYYNISLLVIDTVDHTSHLIY